MSELHDLENHYIAEAERTETFINRAIELIPDDGFSRLRFRILFEKKKRIALLALLEQIRDEL